MKIAEEVAQTSSPAMTAADGARRELAERLQTVERLIGSMNSSAADDARSVHQLRVASRRAGAALAVFEPCLKRRGLKDVRKSLRRVRRLANDVRQFDVNLDLLQNWQEPVPVENRPLLTRLEQVLRAERTESRKMLRQMARKGARAELRDLRRRLLKPLQSCETALTFSDLALQAMANLADSFAEAAGLDLTSLDNVHALRIAGKQIRYSLEVLEGALPGNAAAIRERLQQMQDRLGHINDLTDFASKLESYFAADSLDAPLASERPRLAFDWKSMLGQLIESVRDRLSSQHQSFLGEWSRGEWSDITEGLATFRTEGRNDTAPTEAHAVDLQSETATAGTSAPVDAIPGADISSAKRIAAIDVGTNSIRLVIAEAFADGRLRVIDDERAMTRLGQGLSRSGRLSAKAMEESVLALSQFKAIAEGYKVDALQAVATCAVREARNGQDFVNMVRQRAGVNLVAISAETEARLAFRSVANAFDLRGTRTAVVDIGGGSTEIILGSGNLIEQIYPIPLGAVRLTEKFRISDEVPEKRYQNMRRLIRTTMRERIGRMPFVPHMVVGTGGTFTTLAAMAMQRGNTSKTSDMLPFTVRGYEMQRSELKHMLDQLRDLSLNGRLRVPGVSPERADIIVAGLTLVDCALKELQVNTLRVHDQGIRAGLLHSMADELFPRGDRVATLQPDRIREVRQFAIACNFEQNHAEHVARLSLAIFDQLAQELGESVSSWANAENRELLHAGALVHDVGYFINYSKHHKHSYHLVMHSDLDAFTHRQREIIANVARYHRGACPKKNHANLARLSNKDRELVKRLTAILRLADGLDRSHTQQVESIELHCHEGVAFLRLTTTGDAAVDVWGSMRKSGLFEEMFNVKVRFSCVAVESSPAPPAGVSKSAKGADPIAVPENRLEHASQ